MKGRERIDRGIPDDLHRKEKRSGDDNQAPNDQGATPAAAQASDSSAGAESFGSSSDRGIIRISFRFTLPLP